MRIAYLILVHKSPLQLERVLNALDHPAFDYFIHLDKKADMAPFVYLAKRERVYFIQNNVKVFWGRYSLVQATLNGIVEVLEAGKYDYVHVMSAQDFPIKPASSIYQYLLERRGTEFITCMRETDNHEWWKDAALHTWKYHFHNWRIPGKYRLEALVNRLMAARLLPARKYPIDGHEVVGHSQWFTITAASAAYMLKFLREHPEVVRFFQYVWGADELIFSTVIYNSPFRDKIEDNLVYVDWSEKTPNPKLLTSQDWPALMASDRLFARKFDMEKEEAIVSRLEAWLKH